MPRLTGKLRRQRWRSGLGLVFTLFLLAQVAGYVPRSFLPRLEALAYDLQLRGSLDEGVDRRIVIVDVDERALAVEGQWPWPRDTLAALTKRLLDDFKVELVVFDLVFAEPDSGPLEEAVGGLLQRHAGTAMEAQLAPLRPLLDRDRQFADALRGRPVVLSHIFDTGEEHARRTGTLPAPAFPADPLSAQGIELIDAWGYTGNLDSLVGAAAAAGHINALPDDDGVFRRAPMLIRYQGQLYESLVLAAARIYLGVPLTPGYVAGWDLGRRYVGLEWLNLGSRRVPVDENLAALIPFRGSERSFPFVSATDVLRDSVPDRDVLRGAIALVGTTAPGLMDLRATPVRNVYAGVQIHANLIAGILDGSLKHRPVWVLGAEFLFLLTAGVLLSLLLPVLGAVGATLATLLSVFGVLAGATAAWRFADLVLPVASPLVLIFGLYVFNMSYGYLVESQGKRRLSRMFGQYVPPQLVAEMSEGAQEFSQAGERREMTVLFSDVRGFTGISEGLDPRELVELMNALLTPVTRVIHEYRGTIDKYMGDSVMAFWGAPVPDPDHAANALAAAHEVIASIAKLNANFSARGWPEIRLGVGLNTGIMNVGNMGSEFRRAYTVLGDAVNLGSRLEGLTRHYGVDIIVSEATRAAVPGEAFRELDRVQVKGRAQPLAIFEPLGPAAALDAQRRSELALHEEGLRRYRARDWEQAGLQFLALQRSYPGTRLYPMYVERIEGFRAEPPGEDWDGSYRFTTK